MTRARSLADWMADRGTALADLVAATELDDRVVEAIARGRYTPSPDQRRRLAAALGVDPDQIAWGHVTPVEHVHGHGPQFGRSP
jgi:ribosome-binding protein aMBF1 (putative translation factor)